MFSSNEDLEVGDQQTSLISATEEVIQGEEVIVEDNTSEQQFGVFKDFDFLDVELEDAEVSWYYGSFTFRFFHNTILQSKKGSGTQSFLFFL